MTAKKDILIETMDKIKGRWTKVKNIKGGSSYIVLYGGVNGILAKILYKHNNWNKNKLEGKINNEK